VGRHRCLAFSWADTAGSHPNSVDVSLIGAHATRRPDAPSHGRTLIQTSDYPASLRGSIPRCTRHLPRALANVVVQPQ
jgi:hypothetical protein